MLQGVYLFVIFVLKHSVLFEIRKKYSGQGDNIDMLSLSDGKETLYAKLTLTDSAISNTFGLHRLCHYYVSIHSRFI